MGMFVAGFAVIGIGFGTQGLIVAVISEVLPRKYRSWAQASVNIINAVASIFAVTIGGYLVQSRTDGFRIYFYMCAGINALAIVLVALLYNPPMRQLQSLTTREKLRSLDWPAYGLLGSGTVLLCLGLLWAENPYSWSDAHVLAPLLTGLVILLALVIYAWKYKPDGLFNHALFKKRNFPISVLALAIEGATYMSAAVFFPYSLSVLQAGKLSTYQTYLCQTVGFCAFVCSCFCSGLYIYKTKSLRPTGVATFVFFTIFMSLMASVTESTPTSHFWGYIVLYGTGMGLAQVTYATAAQLSTPPELIAPASGIFVAVRSLGGSIVLAIINAISASGLSDNITPKVTAAVIPLGLPKSSVRPLIAALGANNATALHEVPGSTAQIISAAELALKQAYVVAFRHVFIFGAVFAATGILLASFLNNPYAEFNARIDAPITHVKSDELHIEEVDYAETMDSKA
ncbi:hypothetical protein LTR06_008379 [Exophiala xenobiotica]|nr:hypothetical protein LTR06_008379 [Exophiala xenobiotica]